MTSLEALGVGLLVLETVVLVVASLSIVFTTVRNRDSLLYPLPAYLFGGAVLLVTAGGLFQGTQAIGLELGVVSTIGRGVVTLGMTAFAYATYLLARDTVRVGDLGRVTPRDARPHRGTGFGGEDDE